MENQNINTGIEYEYAVAKALFNLYPNLQRNSNFLEEINKYEKNHEKKRKKLFLKKLTRK